jgi:hypothetical protein
MLQGVHLDLCYCYACIGWSLRGTRSHGSETGGGERALFDKTGAEEYLASGRT